MTPLGWLGRKTSAQTKYAAFKPWDLVCTSIYIVVGGIVFNKPIWANARQNLQWDLCDQRRQISLRIPTVWSVFADCMCLLQRDKGEPLPYWVNVQADLSFAGHVGLVAGFVMCWLISSFLWNYPSAWYMLPIGAGLGGSGGCASDWWSRGQGSIPVGLGNSILLWRLIMKYFLRSFSPADSRRAFVNSDERMCISTWLKA